MSIAILHFSDIHFAIKENSLLKKLNLIFEAVKNKILDKEELFIVTTGDIAYSGLSEEYEIAKREFYNPIYKLIFDYTNKPIRLVFIPGNHDCRFNPTDEKVRKAVLTGLLRNGYNELDENMLDLICKPQENYFDFIKGIKLPYNGDLVLENKLLQIKTFKVRDYVLKFHCFNTSWCSTMREAIGQMAYPIEYVYDQIPSIQAQISISLVHHPFNWQTPENSKAFRKNLAMISDLIISGHEHDSNMGVFGDFTESYSTTHIESAALQELDSSMNSAFNIINLDLDELKMQVDSFKYSKKTNSYDIETSSDWKPITRHKSLKTIDFELTKDFSQWLSNPGAGFIHPNSDSIQLSDIYVSLNVTEVDGNKDSKRRLLQFLNISNVLDINSSTEPPFYKVLLGRESSGKSTILKYHFLRYFEEGFYPIWINAEDIKDLERGKIAKQIEAAFYEQYREVSGKYATIDNNRVVIVLDDLHRFKFKNGKHKFLDILKEKYKFIILSGNELMQFESYLNKNKDKTDLFEGFDKFMIQEMGPTLRNQLVTKWYRIGKEYLSEEDRNLFFRQLDQAENYISSIIGKNLIPSFPIFVLSILQTLATGIQDSGDTNLYGYYYEMLINRAIRRVLSDKEEIGFYVSLFKEYCYFLFSEKIRFAPLSIDDFKTFINRHAKEYNINSINVKQVIETLSSANFISIDHDNFVSIPYKYIYYYFVAKFLSDNIEIDEIREVVELMTERVYREEYSNVILFLTHLSKSQFIIDKLIEKSKQIFSGEALCHLENDVSFINQLQSSIPELIIKDFKVEQSREENIKIREKDESESKQNEEDEIIREEDYDLREDLSTIDMLAYLTKAVRTLNILGHITRKYWGEMKGGQKYALAEETFLLGLRTLKFYFGMLSTSQATLINHVKSIIDRKFVRDQITKAEVETITANLIFSLSIASAFGIIKRIANAIGTEKLSATFQEVEASYPINSVRLINTAIKLDHYNSFPLRDIQELVKTNEKNPLAFVTLQNLVLDHLYMFDVEYKRRQQIFDLLRIKIQHQRIIEATSAIKKKA